MAIAAELRPDWKMGALLLILQFSSRGGKSSLRRLHILNWALRSAKNRAEFEQVREHQQPLFSFQFRFEPRSEGQSISPSVKSMWNGSAESGCKSRPRESDGSRKSQRMKP